MGRFSVSRIVTFVLLAVVAVTGFMVLGPAELGGPVRYAIIDGTSMVPTLTDGDLAIVRVDGEPAKGEVVLYHDPRLGVDVLHRIVRESHGRFVLKGDNNDYLDDANPNPTELGGTLWFSVPYVGSGVEWLRQPLHAALIVFVFAALAFAGGGGATRRHARSRHAVGITASGTQLEGASRGLLTGAFVAAALFALLALVAFSRADTRAEAVEEARVHEGTLSYSAQIEPSDVYPDGTVRSGETAFLQIVPALDVAFTYRITGNDLRGLHGKAAITAVVSDGTGWVRHTPVAVPRAFTGTSATARGTLDLTELTQIVNEMKSMTGSLTTTFSVKLEPEVEVSGRAGTEPFDSTFAPSMPFLLDDISMRVDAPEDGSPALSARTAEPGTVDVPGSLALGQLAISVEQARRLAMIGVLLSLLLLTVAAAALWSSRVDGEHTRIASRFGDRMISIAGAPSVDSARVTDLADVDSLVRVAELHDRVVLHWRRGNEHAYVVDDGATTYRYRSGPSPTETRAKDLEDTLVLPG